MPKKNKGGRPSFEPTAEQTAWVEKMSLAAIPHETIATVIGIDGLTLKKHFAEVLRTAKAKALGRVASGLYQQAFDGNTTAAIFIMKTQGGWRETAEPESAKMELPEIKIQIMTKAENDG
jgi:hypothetical protein